MENNNDSQILGLILAFCCIGSMWGIIALIGMLTDS